MAAWIPAGKGIRYREHPTRKHGKRPDRYWCLQYRLDGKNINEAVGWWSDGASQARCEELLAELRRNHKSGQGPRTLREMRAFNRERRDREAREAALDNKRTLGGFMEAEYLPRAKLTLTAGSHGRQARLLRTWLAPLADRPLPQITADDLEKFTLRPMLEAGRSPNTIRNVLSVFSEAWKLAADLGLARGENPAAKVKRPKVDNQRDRFLTKAEAARLLTVLKGKSAAAHDAALLSLFSGLRIGECLSLTWVDVDLEDGRIFIKDTKTRRNRHAFITAEIREMLARRRQGRPETGQVFNAGNIRNLYPMIMYHFRTAVNELGLNDGRTDRRQKLVFHSLRHTFASWLAQMGKPLFTISRLMGHSSIKMTERYAHLAPDAQRAAAMELEGILGSAD